MAISSHKTVTLNKSKLNMSKADAANFEYIDFLIANFGYKIVNSIHDIDVYDLSAVKLKDDIIVNQKTQYLIPDFKGHPKFEKYQLNFFEYQDDFTKVIVKSSYLLEEGGIARKFSQMNLNDDSSSALEDIVSFANNFGLLVSTNAFAYKNNYFVPWQFINQYCDKLSDWYSCWQDIKTIFYVFDNFDKLTLDNFHCGFENDELITCKFYIPDYSFLHMFDLASDYNNFCKNIQATELDLYKILLKKNIIDLINKNLAISTYLEAQFDMTSKTAATDHAQKIYRARNLKGVIFLDLARYFWENRKVIRCEYCQGFIDATDRNSNITYHKKCYNKKKMPIFRARKKGMNDQEISEKLGIPQSVLLRKKKQKKLIV